MCGIAGYLTKNAQFTGQIDRCLELLKPRGPDCARYFIDEKPDFRLALLHTRFSILDLHERSHQPLFNADQSLGIILNGEIYNYAAVRVELQEMGFHFQTTSDTEVFLHAYDAWREDCFRRLDGFWAAVIFDRKRGELIFSRDRMGKAPLYYAFNGETLVWASAIAPLFALCPDLPRRVNDAVVQRYLIYAARDVDDQTFYLGIRQFPKGSYAVVDCRAGLPAELPVRHFYTLTVPRREQTIRDAEIAPTVEHFWRTFRNSVAKRLRADVPVAFELSGGVDSSCIMAAALELLPPEQIHAYTVKYAQENQDEERFARSVYDYTGRKIQYHVVEPRNTEILTGLQRHMRWMEEPIFSPGGSGGFTHRALAEAIARDGNRVVISGSAGDELYGGYPEEFFYLYIESLLAGGHRELAVEELGMYSEKKLDIDEILPRVRQIKNYNVPFQRRFAPYVHGHGQCRYNTDDYSFSGKIAHWYTEFKVPYWLRAMDKNLMGIPLEGRYPFLDFELAELSLALPESLLFRQGYSKWILRKAMAGKMPDDVVWRRNKMGFPFPIKTFMREHKALFVRVLKMMDSQPYFDASALCRDYDVLTEEVVYGLWRAVNFAIWFQMFFNNNDLLDDIDRHLKEGLPCLCPSH